MLHGQPEHWVFAYGSLMWDPGFAVAECVEARISGFARRFCMQSVVYRGTVEVPGLVLALDEDAAGECAGLALRVAATDWQDTIRALRERELATNAYREEILPVRLADGRDIRALTYVMRRDHDQYMGDISLSDQARMIARATGGRGANSDYLFNTTRHLAQVGLADPALEDLARQVAALLRKTD